jgi:hypothetical protein
LVEGMEEEDKDKKAGEKRGCGEDTPLVLPSWSEEQLESFLNCSGRVATVRRAHGALCKDTRGGRENRHSEQGETVRLLRDGDHDVGRLSRKISQGVGPVLLPSLCTRGPGRRGPRPRER